MSRLRWRSCGNGELETTVGRLERWPCLPGGSIRHMFPLGAVEARGATSLRLASDDRSWAAALVLPGRLVVPCGDPAAIRRAGQPTRRWRLAVGDAAAMDALLSAVDDDPSLRVHHQRYLTVEPERVPDEAAQPDPGLRRAEAADIPALAQLAVQLHIDDDFGPDPGRAGLRGYARRFEQTVRQGLVWCVGPVGRPVCKLERAVDSRRYGVQLAGIVVAPEARGAGLGTAAVAAAVRGALREGPARRPVALHVRHDNGPALRAYDRAGFVDREEWRLAVRP